MANWLQIASSVEKLLAKQEGIKSSFPWQGGTLYGVRTTLRREDVNSDAGLVGAYTYSLLCPYSEFNGKLPIPRTDKLVVDGVEMRVLAVETDAVMSTVRIHLGDALA